MKKTLILFLVALLGIQANSQKVKMLDDGTLVDEVVEARKEAFNPPKSFHRDGVSLSEAQKLCDERVKAIVLEEESLGVGIWRTDWYFSAGEKFVKHEIYWDEDAIKKRISESRVDGKQYSTIVLIILFIMLLTVVGAFFPMGMFEKKTKKKTYKNLLNLRNLYRYVFVGIAILLPLHFILDFEMFVYSMFLLPMIGMFVHSVYLTIKWGSPYVFLYFGATIFGCFAGVDSNFEVLDFFWCATMIQFVVMSFASYYQTIME